MTPGDPAFSLDEERDMLAARPRLRVVGVDDVPVPDGPGLRLQNARLDRGLSVVQVAGALRLKTRHIAGMEATDFSRLPGLGYALGWVRAYAVFLDLPNVDALVGEFRDRWEPVQRAGEVWRPRPKLQIKWPKSSIIAAAFGAWLVVWGVLHVIFAPAPVEDTGPPDAAIQRWATAPAEGLASSPVVATTADTVIRALMPVKVEIRGGDGALAVSRQMQPGDTLSPDGFGRWSLAASDGGAVEVLSNGQAYVPGPVGKPVSNWRTPAPVVVPVDGVATAVPGVPGAVVGAVAAPAGVANPSVLPAPAVQGVQPQTPAAPPAMARPAAASTAGVAPVASRAQSGTPSAGATRASAPSPTPTGTQPRQRPSSAAPAAVQASAPAQPVRAAVAPPTEPTPAPAASAAAAARSTPEAAPAN